MGRDGWDGEGWVGWGGREARGRWEWQAGVAGRGGGCGRVGRWPAGVSPPGQHSAAQRRRTARQVSKWQQPACSQHAVRKPHQSTRSPPPPPSAKGWKKATTPCMCMHGPSEAARVGWLAATGSARAPAAEGVSVGSMALCVAGHTTRPAVRRQQIACRPAAARHLPPAAATPPCVALEARSGPRPMLRRRPELGERGC